MDPACRHTDRFEQAMAVLRRDGLFGDGPKRSSRPSSYQPRTGDILLRLLASSESIGLASLNLSGYSHCGVVHEIAGEVFVDDCYPPCNKHPGGPRRTPLATWRRLEGEDAVVHWLALRCEAMDRDRAVAALTHLATSGIRFDLVADMAADAGEVSTDTANCSLFALHFLRLAGFDGQPALGLARVNRLVLSRFFQLCEAGFYDLFPANSGRSFYQAAKDHGFTREADWQRSVLPAGFCELLPDFIPEAYGQNLDVPAMTRHFATHYYRRHAPMLQAALACHGASPEQALPLAVSRGGADLARLVKRLPAGVPINGAALAVDLLLAQADTPDPYLTIPQSSYLALVGARGLTRRALEAALWITPQALGWARRLGWRPLRIFAPTP